jgi:hypothetical protein
VVNSYLAGNTLGTGPFLLQDYNGVVGGGYTLQPNPSYWGTPAATLEPWNVDLAAANTTVDVIFQDAIDITTNDLLTGAVQEASFAYIGPSTIQQLEGHTNVVVQPLPTIYGATSGSWWIFLNSSVAPFNNLSVREAITHAINYQQIIQQAFGGYAQQWVGPVPPAYPYNNNVTAAEPYYAYDLTLAQAEIANSPCANGACSGDSINYMYLNTGNDWVETAQFLEADLKAIGITINPVGVDLDQLYEEQGLDASGACETSTTANGGPFYMGQEFYTSDYISPDDWTQNDAYSLGSANECMAGFANQTVDTDTYAAASSDVPANLTAYYTNMTNIMYDNYSEIWLVVPTAFALYATSVHGAVLNPMGSAQPYSLLFNTQWASPPPTYSVTVLESGLPSETSWYVNLTDGADYSSAAGAIDFAVPNGSYSYSVATTDSEYAPSSARGVFQVSGISLNESVVFSLVTYPVMFDESGLAATAEWWVNVGGQNTSANASTQTVNLANGSYSYTASAPGHFTLRGNLTVRGPPTGPVSLAFSSSGSASSPPFLFYAVIVGAVAVAVCVAAVLIRRRAKPPPDSVTSTSTRASGDPPTGDPGAPPR